MIVLDNNLLSDYLDGEDAARAFLEQRETEAWGVSTIVLYEAEMGAVHGYIDSDPGTIREAITASMDVLEVSQRTVSEAVTMQERLLDRGVPVDHPDALIAATAREHGATFATAEKTFWDEAVREVVPVAKYDPYRE